MIRKSLSAVVILLGISCACAQSPDANKQTFAPHLFTTFGTFEKVQDGWRCKAVGRQPPELLRDLQIGDVITALDDISVGTANPIRMLQMIRLLELGIARAVEVNRAGARLKWAAQGGPQVVASQFSFKVFRSTVPGVEPGDVLTAIGESRFTAMMTQVENPLTALVTVEVKPGKILHLARNAAVKDIPVGEPTTVRLLNFDVDFGEQPRADTVLHGVNGADLKLTSLTGHWALLHFWATWCKPCIRHLPDTRVLSKQSGLTVAAIGFADTEGRLQEMGKAEKDLKIFAPSTDLQRAFAIIGIPFDVLLDPKGTPVLVVSGDMPGAEFTDIVMSYVRQ